MKIKMKSLKIQMMIKKIIQKKIVKKMEKVGKVGKVEKVKKALKHLKVIKKKKQKVIKRKKRNKEMTLYHMSSMDKCLRNNRSN